MSDNGKKVMERLTERAEHLADDLRVRAHLVGVEAKGAWDKAHLERVSGELGKLRDELKVQAHLAGMNAKSALHHLETRIDALSANVGATGVDGVLRELSAAAHDLGMAMREALHKSGEPQARKPSSGATTNKSDAPS